MRIVIVEDRPLMLQESIRKIRNVAEVSEIVYVYQDIDDADRVKEKMDEEFKDITIIATDNDHFDANISKVYENRDNLILCDYNLTGGKGVYFEKRVNIIFAKKIKNQNPSAVPSARIWFYTTAGENANELINKAFPERNISVEKVEDNQIILDMDDIKEALEIASKEDD